MEKWWLVIGFSAQLLFSARFLDFYDFSPEEKKELVQENISLILKHIEKISKQYPNMFLYIFKEKLLYYLNPEEKEQLLELVLPQTNMLLLSVDMVLLQISQGFLWVT